MYYLKNNSFLLYFHGKFYRKNAIYIKENDQMKRGKRGNNIEV